MISTVMTGAAALALLQSSAANPATPPPPPKCDAAEYAQFDFWVGEWTVYPTGSEKKVADSIIERLYAGCAVRENWNPLNGQAGGSLNSYDAQTGLWHQLWIGSSPGRVEFSGGFANGKIVLTGNWPAPAAKHQLIRMSYTPNEDGSVRQFGEASTDHGVTWVPSFDFTYRPKPETTEGPIQ